MNILSILSTLTENSSINALSILFVLLLIFSFRFYKKKIINKMETIIRFSAIIIFIGGFVVYFIGFTNGAEGEGTAGSWMAFVFRPIISSLEMFVSHSDLLEVAPELKENALYMTFFSFFHFAAVAITGIIAVYYLGARMVSWFKWRKMIIMNHKYETMHVFLDADDASMLLAEDIRKKDPDANSDLILLFFCQHKNDEEEKEGVGSMFNMFSFRKDLLIKAYSMKMFIKRLNAPVYRYDGSDILKKLSLLKGLKLVSNINIYFLSQDENANILSSIKIKNDSFLSANKCDNKHIRIFCRASKNGANAVFEQHVKNSVETVFVDNSYLSVWSLRTLPLYCDGEAKPFLYASHPVNFIDIDPDSGMSLSPFHSAIIGFDETGQEALRFLYEYGQFVYPEDAEGEHFRCDIFDAKLDKYKGRFLTMYPHFANAEAGIHWNNTDHHSTDFWNKLHNDIDTLNYVVLAMGDDEKNMTLAVDIYDFALRFRKNGLQHFGIFVRSYNFANEKRLEDIASLHKNKGENVIYVFGKLSDLYTKNRICDDKLQDAAALFSYIYNKSRKGETENEDNIQINTETIHLAKEIWTRRHNENRSDFAHYMDTLREESQKLSDAYHIYTKMKMVGLDELRDMVMAASGSSYVSLKHYENSPFLSSLARLEHKRWCASLYAMGYMPMSEEEFQKLGKPCDVIHKKHRCLVDWDKLADFKEANYQYYQELAVITSFGLFYNKEIDDVYRNV